MCVVAGCGGASSNGVTSPVSSVPVLTVVRLSLSSDTLQVGQSMTANITGLDQNNADIGVGGTPTWSLSTPGVATVSTSGVITAVAPGKTTVIVSVNGKQAQGALTVVLVPVARVAISPGDVRVARGATAQLTAAALDFNGRVLTGRTIDWATSDATIATVSSAGVVTSISTGVTTVLAKSEGARASAVVTVTGSADSVATIAVNPTSATLTVGGTVQLSATLKDITGKVLTGRAVTWLASGVVGVPVATVSATGLVTAASPGTVIIEAFAEGQHGAVTVTVKDSVDATIVVTFAAPVENALVGDTLQVIANVTSAYPFIVVAAVGSRTTILTLTRVGALGLSQLWVGQIDITDIASGSYLVTVTATDSRGARGVATRQFLRDTRTGKGGSFTPPRQK